MSALGWWRRRLGQVDKEGGVEVGFGNRPTHLEEKGGGGRSARR